MDRWRMLPKPIKCIVRQTHQQWISAPIQRRSQSTVTSESTNATKARVAHPPPPSRQEPLPPLSVMPTPLLLRSLVVTWVLSSPGVVNLCIPIMHRISHSKSWFLNPDRNPVLHRIVRGLVYDHFCAGENKKEVKETMETMRQMGFEGVILGYAKETLVDEIKNSKTSTGLGATTSIERAVKEWKNGTLRTLAMLGLNDFLAVKFTGAGPIAIEAMTRGVAPPPVMHAAMTEICEQALKQNTRIWIDAEQQLFQHTIDAWTIDLMRRYNRDGRVLIYNTLQAYLKGTPKNIAHHLSLAQKEGWSLGIKLVRGAYIAIEQRELIHDTIEDTHAAYNSIVQDLLSKKFPGITKGEEFPHLQLFLASHNAESVKMGYETWKERNEIGLPTIKLEVGQLQGMADETSCGLVQMRQQMTADVDKSSKSETTWYPRAFKCLCWGKTQECVQFLMRRVIENRGSLDRTKFWMVGLRRELWRRVRASIGLR